MSFIYSPCCCRNKNEILEPLNYKWYCWNNYHGHPSIRIHIVHRIVIAVDIRADAGILFCQRVRGRPAGEVTELASLFPNPE